MKIVVLSDLHLSNKFNRQKFKKIVEVISSADKVILNGDFWEGFQISFNTFINSEWSKLFPLLKAKNTIYIYGNHDPHNLADRRVYLFSYQQKYSHIELISDKVYLFEHGHQFCPLPIAGNELSLPWKVRSTITNLAAPVCFRTPKSFLGRIFCIPLNRKIKKSIKNKLTNVDVYVCGHTHAAEIDLKNRFVNSGACCYGSLQYIVISEGKIKLNFLRLC